jgi:micrococcal nuclease
MFEYPATIIRVVDGDTVDLNIDLGFTVHVVQRVRLNGINAPEKNTEAGLIAKHWLEAKLPAGSKVVVKSDKPGGGDKYGRYLATIFLSESSVNEELVASGHAFAWDGKGVKPTT